MEAEEDANTNTTTKTKGVKSLTPKENESASTSKSISTSKPTQQEASKTQDNSNRSSIAQTIARRRRSRTQQPLPNNSVMERTEKETTKTTKPLGKKAPDGEKNQPKASRNTTKTISEINIPSKQKQKQQQAPKQNQTSSKMNRGRKRKAPTPITGPTLHPPSKPKPQPMQAFQEEADHLLQLLDANTRGQPCFSQIEESLASLVANSDQKKNQKKKKSSNEDEKEDKCEKNTPKLTPPKPIPVTSCAIQDPSAIVPDEDNYDDDDDDEKNNNKKSNDTLPNKPNNLSTNTDGMTKPPPSSRWTISEPTPMPTTSAGPSFQIRMVDADSSSTTTTSHDPRYRKGSNMSLDEIPLGRSGARMMVTFGDGPNPIPETVQAALLATRDCLQKAIQDARALRRRVKLEFHKARIASAMHQARTKDKNEVQKWMQGDKTNLYHKYNYDKNDSTSASLVVTHSEVDPVMLYRAIVGYDPISFDPQCGFDVSQLETLFPEEMHAYRRWEKMHQAYKASAEEGAATKPATPKDDNETTPTKNKSNPNPEDNDDNKEEDEEEEEEEWKGGHQFARLAQFDARTARMKQSWYMAFAKVRNGSFLTRASGGRKKSDEERQWDATRKKPPSDGSSRRGRKSSKRSTWTRLSATAVQFLHWVGFDVRSALSPPNEETTEALAFLGYDFLGKVVEKAIFMRYMHEGKVKKDFFSSMDWGEDRVVLELGPKEQLLKEDIARAVEDEKCTTLPIYNVAFPVMGGSMDSGVVDVEEVTSEATIEPSAAAATGDSDKSIRSAGDGKATGASAAKLKHLPSLHKQTPQLYFGPGFEESLEMELDHMLLVRSRKQETTSQEERRVRDEERRLFEKLKKPPTVLKDFSPFLDDADEHGNQERKADNALRAEMKKTEEKQSRFHLGREPIDKKA